MTRARRVFALDLGTTKICCAVADADESGLRILGIGEAASRGVRKGAVIDIDQAAEAVAEAVDAAEQMSGIPVDSVVVGLPGNHVASQNSHGVVAVAAGHREIRSQDVNRAIEAARAVSVAGDRKIVHVLPQQFTIDGQPGVRDAVGMAGSRLEVDVHIVTGAVSAISNVAKVVHEAGLDVDDMVLQPIASAEGVASDDELERGVVVADIGGGTIDVAVFAGGSITYTSVLPVGGNHVTADLAVGLRCDLDTAEVVKRSYGHCLQLTVPADAEVVMTPIGNEGPTQVPQRYLAEIIGPRAREMATLVAREIERAGRSALFPGGVVLTGGGANLRGLGEMMQQVTELPCRVGAPRGLSGMSSEVSGAQHAAVVGLIRWGARSTRGRSQVRAQNGQNGNGHGHAHGAGGAVGATFGRWLRELF